MSLKNKFNNGTNFAFVGNGTKKVKYWQGGLSFVWLGEKGNGIGWFNYPVMF